MDEQTKQALEGSIDKWEAIVAGTGVDRGRHNCPLCRLFYILGCKGCPVYLKTGAQNCRKTPYERWKIHGYRLYGCSTIEGTKIMEMARDELEFLKSLREPSANVS